MRKAGVTSRPDDQNPVVSMVMATNRSSPFLEEAVDSMVRQGYPQVEIIIIDDGSPDPQALVDLLSGYPEVRLHRQTPAGISVARNTGVALSQGALIGFFDDDDRYPPDWIERHVANLGSRPEAVLSYGGLRLIDSTGQEFGAVTEAPPSPSARAVRRRDMQLLAGSFVLRRADFEALGGFNPLFGGVEDLDLVLRCLARGAFVPVPGLLRDYRTHSANVTRDHHMIAQGIDRVVRLHRETARAARDAAAVGDYSTSLAVNRRFASWRSGQALRADLQAGLPSAAAAELLWILRFVPEAPLLWTARGLVQLGTRLKAAGRSHSHE